jgi:hypothetical protein
MNDAQTLDAQAPVAASPSAATEKPVLPQDYIKRHETIFGSHESWRYFVRQHRAALVEAGALTAPTGRLLVMPAAFDRVVQEVGQRMAGTKLR